MKKEKIYWKIAGLLEVFPIIITGYINVLIAASCYLVRVEKVKTVGTSSDRKRKMYRNRNVDFGYS